MLTIQIPKDYFLHLRCKQIHRLWNKRREVIDIFGFGASLSPVRGANKWWICITWLVIVSYTRSGLRVILMADSFYRYTILARVIKFKALLGFFFTSIWTNQVFFHINIPYWICFTKVALRDLTCVIHRTTSPWQGCVCRIFGNVELCKLSVHYLILYFAPFLSHFESGMLQHVAH